jgi:hypothetical protein
LIPDSLKERITEALKYWEPMRIVYNAVLAIEVVGYYFIFLPASKTHVTRETVLFVFVLAVGANIVYCAAYPVDLFVQVSALRHKWRTYRYLLFALGLALAATFTRWFAFALFST